MHKTVPILNQLVWRTATQCSTHLQLLVAGTSVLLVLVRHFSFQTIRCCVPCFSSHPDRWSMTYPQPVRILYPLVTPSFPMIGLMIQPTFQCALFFVVSFISHSEPFFRQVVPCPASGRELKRSCKAWSYSFSQRLRTLSRQVFKYLSPFLPKGFSIDEWNRLALDRVKFTGVLVGQERINLLVFSSLSLTSSRFSSR